MKPGARVEMTEAAIEQGLHGLKNRRTGVVAPKTTEATIADGYVYVLRDREKQASRWALKFWKLVDDKEK